MQRLHEDDLVGHVLKQGDWKVLKFPAIAEEDENYLWSRHLMGAGSDSLVDKAKPCILIGNL